MTTMRSEIPIPSGGRRARLPPAIVTSAGLLLTLTGAAAAGGPCSEPGSRLDVAPSYVLQADRPGAFLGSNVSAAGDVDGDGLADLLVAAPSFENGEESEGAIFLFLGTEARGRVAPSWVLEGGRPGAFLLWASAAGDVNGDGFDDVIVGDPFWSVGLEERGRAMLFPGSPDGPALEPAWTIEGDRARRHLGGRVGGAGDVNRDGLADVVVSGSGVVLVFLGSSAGLATAPAWSVQGELPSDSGRGPAFLDVNGDGFDDLLVAVFGDAFSQVVSLYRGYPLGLRPRSHADLRLPAEGGNFGIAFDPTQDVDGDGAPEIVVGLIGRLDVPHGSPCCPPEPVLLFEAGGRGLREPGSLIHQTRFHGDLVALGIGGAGDVNGDGFGDLMVAEHAVDPNAGGIPPIRVLLFAGSAGGVATAPAAVLRGDQPLDGFGEAAAAAGDFDGDGCDDVVVGAPRHDGAQVDEGAAFVFRGGAFAGPAPGSGARGRASRR